MTHFIHRYTAWGEPKRFYGSLFYQRKVCLVCNKVKERSL